MMNIKIRTADPPQDFERIAELLSADPPENTSATELLNEYKIEMAGRTMRHAVAVDEQNPTQVVGFSFAGHYPSMQPHQYYADIVVDPRLRGQGIGRQMWDELATYLREQEADELLSEVQEKVPNAFDFAKNRGFTVHSHQLRAILDLSNYESSQFAHIPQAVEAAGIRLTSFADVDQTEENTRQLYDINGVAALDDPASDGGYVAYENWKKVILGASWFQPAGQMVALDGEKFVGLSAISYDGDEQIGATLISGVDAAYRDRKIMQALKYKAIEYAVSHGATRVETELAVNNDPMRAINTKFGFVEGPGRFELVVRQR